MPSRITLGPGIDATLPAVCCCCLGPAQLGLGVTGRSGTAGALPYCAACAARLVRGRFAAALATFAGALLGGVAAGATGAGFGLAVLGVAAGAMLGSLLAAVIGASRTPRDHVARCRGHRVVARRPDGSVEVELARDAIPAPAAAVTEATVAVVAPHATGLPEAVFWAHALCWHLGKVLARRHPIRTEEIIPVHARLGAAARPSVPESNPLPVERAAALDMARQAGMSSAIWGRIDLGETLAVHLEYAAASGAGAPAFELAVPLQAAGVLLDGAVDWAMTATGVAGTRAFTVAALPAESIGQLYRAVFAGKRAAETGAPLASVLEVLAPPLLAVLKRHGDVPLVADVLTDVCATATDPTDTAAANRVLADAQRLAPHNERLAAAAPAPRAN